MTDETLKERKERLQKEMADLKEEMKKQKEEAKLHKLRYAKAALEIYRNLERNKLSDLEIRKIANALRKEATPKK